MLALCAERHLTEKTYFEAAMGLWIRVRSRVFCCGTCGQRGAFCPDGVWKHLIATLYLAVKFWGSQELSSTYATVEYARLRWPEVTNRLLFDKEVYIAQLLEWRLM